MKGPPFRRPPHVSNSKLGSNTSAFSRNSRPKQHHTIPDLAHRLRALHEALVLWALDPYEPAPQPRYFILHLPDFTPEQLEEWRRQHGR